MKVVRSVAIFGVVLAATGRLAFKTFVPQSTAEGVALGKYLLGDSGLLSDGVGKHFFPWKAAFFSMTRTLKGFMPSPPGGSAHLATRTLGATMPRPSCPSSALAPKDSAAQLSAPTPRLPLPA